MDVFIYLTPIAALSGLILSIISIVYTYYQNQRRIEVDIKFDDSGYYTFEDVGDITIKLLAFNAGFRPVSIINYELLVNNKIVRFTSATSYLDRKENVNIIVRPDCNNKFPHALNEGEITVARIKVGDLARVLKNVIIDKKRLKGEVELSGYFETGDNKKYFAKNPIKFNIDDWYMH